MLLVWVHTRTAQQGVARLTQDNILQVGHPTRLLRAESGGVGASLEDFKALLQVTQ